ncbi:MAG: hypothetical protein AAFW64_00115 [Pseudomonadota bacterium]
MLHDEATCDDAGPPPILTQDYGLNVAARRRQVNLRGPAALKLSLRRFGPTCG